MSEISENVEGLKQGYGDDILIKDFNLRVEVGERIAIIGENGIGKSTLLNTLATAMELMSGMVKWSENHNIGFYAQDHGHDFAEEMNLLDWMGQWKQDNDDEQVVRGILGRMLFLSPIMQNEIKKSIKVISGGEQERMLLGKLIVQKPNILLMDEPTNHIDIESIEALNLALENYPGTLIFISHDRQFVTSLATRVIEITKESVNDFHGTYEEFLSKR